MYNVTVSIGNGTREIASVVLARYESTDMAFDAVHRFNNDASKPPLFRKFLTGLRALYPEAALVSKARVVVLYQ